MGRCLACCAFVVLFASCSQQEADVASPAKSAPSRPAVVQASALAPAPAVAADPFAEEYRAITESLDDSEGDKDVVDAARARAMAIVSKDRNYARAYVLLARCEALHGTGTDESTLADGRERAWRLINRALAIAPEDFEVNMGVAWLAVGEGDLGRAEEALRVAGAARPGDDAPKVVRVAIAHRENDHPKMVRLAREVIAEVDDPFIRFQAYRHLLYAYEGNLHLDEADAVYKEMLKLRPESAWVRGRYSRLLLHRDDVEGAIREGEKALSIRRYPVAVAALVGAYLRKGQEQWDAGLIAESTATVQKVAGLADDSPELMVALGQFYEYAALRGRDASFRRKALGAYRRALELNPRHMEAERSAARLTKYAG